MVLNLVKLAGMVALWVKIQQIIWGNFLAMLTKYQLKITEMMKDKLTLCEVWLTQPTNIGFC